MHVFPVKLRPPIFAALFSVLVLGFFQPAAAAREIAPVRGLPEHALAALPDAVELALLIDKAAQIRTTEGGQKLWAIISSSGLLKQLEQSWPVLAKDLELTPEHAFDELLGKRAIIASSATFSDHSQWVLITHVTADVERSLRERLRPAARGLVHGFPILAVGGGKYELATSAIAGDDDTEKLSTVILAPGGTSLFDDVLQSLASRDSEILTLPVPKLQGRVDAMALLRNPETARRTIVAATIGMRSWDIEFASDNPTGTPVATLPAAMTQSLFSRADSALLAAAAAQGTASTSSAFGMLTQILWSLIPLDQTSQEAFASGAALSISPRESISWALPITDNARAAVIADSSMTTLFATINRAGPGFRGEAPQAVRKVRTSLSIANQLARLMDPEVTLQWQVQAAADGRPWWVATCGNVPETATNAPTNCVYYFSIRPEPALVALGSAQILDTAPFSALKQIRLIQFSACADPAQGASWCSGSGKVELVP